jgi:hypothetical protein
VELALVHEIGIARKIRPDVDDLTVAIAKDDVEPIGALEHVPAREPRLRDREKAIEDVEDEDRPTE